MPIPDAVAGTEFQTPEPLNQLAPLIIDVAGKRLRLEISEEEWEKQIEEARLKFNLK